MVEDVSLARRPQRDWVSVLMNGAASMVVVVIAMLTWGRGVETQIADTRALLAGLTARVEAIDAERKSDIDARRAADAALTLKLDQMSANLATISAQLDDLRRGLRR